MGRHRLTVEERRVPSVTPDLAAFDAAAAWAWAVAMSSGREPMRSRSNCWRSERMWDWLARNCPWLAMKSL